MLQLTIVKKIGDITLFHTGNMTHFMRLTISKKSPPRGGDEINEKLIIIKEPINPLIYCNINGCQL